MSDDVRIVGFDQNVPQWATEKTLEDVREIFRKSYALDKERTATLDAAFDEIQKTRTITSRYLASINQAVKGNAINDNLVSVKRKEAKAVQDVTDQTGKLGKEMMLTGSSFETFLRHPVKLLGSKFAAIAGTWGTGVGVMGLFTKIVKDSIDTFTTTVDSFRTFNEIGIQYSGTFMEYQHQLADSGMKVSEMAEIVEKYSRTVGTYSLRTIHNFTQQMENSAFQFENFGLTQKEGIEYTTKYLERQRLMGVFDMRNEEEHRQALRKNIRDLTAYSKIMNISREEMLKKQEEFFDRGDIRAYLASLEEGQRESVGGAFDSMANVLSSLGMDNFTDIVADSLVKGSPFASEKLQELMQAAPRLGRELAEVIQEVQDGVQVDPSIIADRLLPAAEADRHIIQPLLTAGNAGAEMAGEFLYNMRLYETNFKKLQEEIEARAGKEGGLVDANVVAMAGLRDSMNKFVAELDVTKVELFAKALGVDPQSGAIGAVTALDNALQEATSFLTNTIQTLPVDKWTGGIYEMLGIQDSLGKKFLTLGAMVGAVSLAMQGAAYFLVNKVGAKIAAAFAGGGGAAGAGGVLAAGKLLARRIPLVMAAFGAVEGIQGFNADKDAGFIDRLGNAGSSALSGATMGFFGSSAVEISERAKTAAPATPQSRRIQPPEQISQTEIDEAINSMTDDDLAPLLKSIAMASNAQLEKVSELVRLVRSGQTGITGQQYG